MMVVLSCHSMWECLLCDNREVEQVLPWVSGQPWIRDLTFLKLRFFHLEICLMTLIICRLPFTCQTFVYTYVRVLTYSGPWNSTGLKCTFMWTFFFTKYVPQYCLIYRWMNLQMQSPVYGGGWLDYQL